ncbi:MAG: hypothetical protein HW416_2756 [Chloroflexi bacterium]|nr:hypothetical protein [Chloroflexota bacterium]
MVQIDGWSRESLLAQLYDWEHDAFDDDLSCYCHLAANAPGPVLEICSGSGRILAPLVDNGIAVVGVDRSPEMLARATARLGLRPGLQLVEADVSTDDLPLGEFGLVIAALNALGYLRSTEDQLKLLRRIGARLLPEGRLVLDLLNVGSIVDQPQGISVLQKSGPNEEIGAHVTKWMVQQLHWATQELSLLSFFDVTGPDGRLQRLTDETVLRFFSRFEIELLVGQAGFTVEELSGDYDGSPFVEGSPRLIVVARASSLEQ